MPAEITVTLRLVRCECDSLVMPPILSHLDGAQCVGCGREFDEVEYAELLAKHRDARGKADDVRAH